MNQFPVTCKVINTRATLNMWRAVIHLALSDAADRSNKNALHQRSAINWIQKGGKDFCMVCDMAGYSPEYVRGRFLKLMEKRSKKGKKP